MPPFNATVQCASIQRVAVQRAAAQRAVVLGWYRLSHTHTHTTSELSELQPINNMPPVNATVQCPAAQRAASHRAIVLGWYRKMLRYCRRAVLYSQPASTVARDMLRASFRDTNNNNNNANANAETFEAKRLSRTGYFLYKAGAEAGLEHRIVKNLLLCKYWKDHNAHLARLSWAQLADPNNAQNKAARKPYVFFCLWWAQTLGVCCCCC